MIQGPALTVQIAKARRGVRWTYRMQGFSCCFILLGTWMASGDYVDGSIIGLVLNLIVVALHIVLFNAQARARAGWRDVERQLLLLQRFINDLKP